MSDDARTAGTDLAKMIGLIAVAVVLGIVLLQVVDDGGGGGGAAPAASGTTTTTAATTTTTARSSSTTPAAKAPAQVKYIVLNGGASAGAAGRTTDALKSKGYTSALPANDDSQQRTGNAVMCRAGLDATAAALAQAVGSGTTVVPFRSPPPPHSSGADCVVVVGG